MSPNWPKLASLSQKTCTLDSFQFFGVILASEGKPFYRTYSIGSFLTKYSNNV